MDKFILKAGVTDITTPTGTDAMPSHLTRRDREHLLVGLFLRGRADIPFACDLGTASEIALELTDVLSQCVVAESLGDRWTVVVVDW